MKIELEWPIEMVDGSKVRAIVLRMATPDDFVGMQSTSAGEGSVQLLAILGDLPEQLIDEMDAGDLLTALRAVATMLQQSPSPTGETTT